MNKFEKDIEVRWSDVDPNRHVRHSAYYDYGAHVRTRFFTALGFSSTKMATLNIGPILFKEECSFIKEIHAEDTIRINILRGPIAAYGATWVLHHEISNQHHKCAHITIKGAWLDLVKRKLVVPPGDIGDALMKLEEGEEYVYGKKPK